jgi:hypothetical protein
MTTLSELMLRANVALPQAEAWAKKAVDVLVGTHTFRSKPVECLTCEVVALFNYGSFREVCSYFHNFLCRNGYSVVWNGLDVWKHCRSQESIRTEHGASAKDRHEGRRTRG